MGGSGGESHGDLIILECCLSIYNGYFRGVNLLLISHLSQHSLLILALSLPPLPLTLIASSRRPLIPPTLPSLPTTLLLSYTLAPRLPPALLHHGVPARVARRRAAWLPSTRRASGPGLWLYAWWVGGACPWRWIGTRVQKWPCTVLWVVAVG